MPSHFPPNVSFSVPMWTLKVVRKRTTITKHRMDDRLLTPTIKKDPQNSPTWHRVRPQKMCLFTLARVSVILGLKVLKLTPNEPPIQPNGTPGHAGGCLEEPGDPQNVPMSIWVLFCPKLTPKWLKWLPKAPPTRWFCMHGAPRLRTFSYSNFGVEHMSVFAGVSHTFQKKNKISLKIQCFGTNDH